jgi:hypothetical protein
MYRVTPEIPCRENGLHPQQKYVEWGLPLPKLVVEVDHFPIEVILPHLNHKKKQHNNKIEVILPLFLRFL